MKPIPWLKRLLLLSATTGSGIRNCSVSNNFAIDGAVNSFTSLWTPTCKSRRSAGIAVLFSTFSPGLASAAAAVSGSANTAKTP